MGVDRHAETSMRTHSTGRARRALPFLVPAAFAVTLDCGPATRAAPGDGAEARPPRTAIAGHGGQATSPSAALLSDTTLAQHATGRRIVEAVCATCHSLQPPPKTAPPLAMIAMHYRRRSAGDAEAIDRMVDWVRAPDAAKSLMPPMVIREFGLMPPQPLPDSLLRAAAAYVMSLQHAMQMRPGERHGMTGRARRGPP